VNSAELIDDVSQTTAMIHAFHAKVVQVLLENNSECVMLELRASFFFQVQLVVGR